MHHIDIHVSSVGLTRKLFDALMPLAGYELRAETDDYVSYWKDRQRPSVGFIEDPPTGSGAMQLAFAVPTADAVNEAAAIARTSGAKNITGPALHEEYGDDYYAVFFEDADGNRYEVLRDR